MGDEKYDSDDQSNKGAEEQGSFPDARRTIGEVRSNVGEILSRIRWPLWWPWTPIEPSAEEPATDVFDVGPEFRVLIDLPGVAKENINIRATRDSIEIAATKAEDRAQHDAKYISRERDCTSFKRVLALSEEIIPDETDASFEDGILTIILKKRPAEPVRERVKVDIK